MWGYKLTYIAEGKDPSFSLQAVLGNVKRHCSIRFN